MPDRLKVLHVIEATAHGTGRHLLDLVRHVPADHHVVLPRKPSIRGEHDPEATARALAQLGVTVHRAPMRRQPLHPDLGRAIIEVRRLTTRLRPDVVHGHATVGGTVARLAAARRAAVVYTPNGLHPSRAVRLVERSLAPLATAIVAVSSSERDLLLAAGAARPDQVVVIPNGIDPRAPRPSGRNLRNERGVPDDASIVGFVGRLARQKGPDVLVTAARLLPSHVHVVVVGDGPRAEAVAAQVHATDLSSRVHLLGHVEDAAALLPQFDVLVLPSRWEGAPYVPLEAFRAGVPVVATDVVGTVDVVTHEVTGLLVPRDDPVVLAAAVRRVLADDRLASGLVRAAAEELTERFDVALMARATLGVYRDVTTPGGASV
ncbi:MAG: glycosyltransferase [Actinobacteria bacterium]|nr:glycosyltransferase [Actinomycetota bacterium]